MNTSESSSETLRIIPWPKYFLAVALGATVIGALLSSKTLFSINKKITDAKEAARPAIVKVTKITTPSCADCFSVEGAVNALKQQNISVAEERSLSFDSPEAEALILKLGIKKVPTYVVTGEVTKPSLENFVKSNGEIKDDTFIFTNVTPIFIDHVTKQKAGFVAVTYLTDPSCVQCVKLDPIIQTLEKLGVKTSSTNQLAWYSSGGQKLISQYNITQIPAMILSSDIGYYGNVKSFWPQIGTIEPDGTYVTRKLNPPYRDVQKDKIVGIVNVIYLEDSSCRDCYKAQEVHKQVLAQGFGVGIGSAQVIDAQSSSGQALIEKYKITRVPTVLISSQAADYPALTSQWPQVGTIEKDGRYVFRTMEALGGITYKDLGTGKIINPAQNNIVPGQ